MLCQRIFINMPRLINWDSTTVSHMSMFSGQGLVIFGETAEIASSGIAEDYPKTGVLANVVTRLGPKTDKGWQIFVL